MSTIAKICKKAESEVKIASVDMRGKLDNGELLIGPPTVEEVDTSDLTISSKTVSSDDLIIEDQTVPAGMAVQFRVSGGAAGKKYKMKITVTTNSTPPQTLIENVMLRIIPD